jgi:tetratricopeptide (TPR) repeat protein
MAQAQIQLKQYPQALNFINKALAKNPQNTSYLYCKSKILILSENYKGALKFIQKLEDENALGLIFKNDFAVQKEYILENLAKNDVDKKYHSAKTSYIKGDYYKSIKKCDEILSTNKNSYKTLALLGANNLKIGNLTQAEQNFQQAYEKNEKYAPALEGLGDIQFINFNYALALKYHQKAFEQSKNALLANKIILDCEFTHDSKISEKFKKEAVKLDEKPFFEYYEIATTLGRYDTKDRLLRQEYIIKSIVTYPLYQNSWSEFARIQISKQDYAFAKNILFAVSLGEKADYQYYYNCALLNLGLKKPHEALENLKTALSLNENYLPAKELQAEILADTSESI